MAAGPSMTAALSLYAESTPAGDASVERRIIWNSDAPAASPSIRQVALKILWRQCSLLACANIMSSTSVGSRPSRLVGGDQVVDLVGRQRQAEIAVGALEGSAARAPTGTVASGAGRAWSNRRAASSGVSSTTSVMRSWSAAPSAAGSRTSPRTVQATPRSSRRTAASPEIRAMSVAFDDHGEIVPNRGTTQRRSAPSPAPSPSSSSGAATRRGP